MSGQGSNDPVLRSPPCNKTMIGASGAAASAGRHRGTGKLPVVVDRDVDDTVAPHAQNAQGALDHAVALVPGGAPDGQAPTMRVGEPEPFTSELLLENAARLLPPTARPPRRLEGVAFTTSATRHLGLSLRCCVPVRQIRGTRTYEKRGNRWGRVDENGKFIDLPRGAPSE